MFWADKVAEELKKRKLPLEWVDDMKTPSGKIHVGSLFGVVFHDLAYKALLDHGVKAKYTYVFENHDPMDDIPSYLPREKFEQYLGMPLFMVPSPVEGFDNYAAYYATDFQNTFNKLGCHPEIIWTKDLYTSGKMNDGIKTVLDNADKIRAIYSEMYKRKVAEDWFPFQVYCTNCHKVTTTRVYKWDGKYVWYRCEIDAVDWTKGCGNDEKISPFSDQAGMRGKMPWKVEWAVKWQAIGVTVEGAGKDHMSKGGSHDLASLVCERVLHYPVPYPISYEFMLIGGRKMSSSKGRGFSASDILDILPPEIARFLIVKMDIKKQTNFDPTEKDTIPGLFDEYQLAYTAYKNKSESELSRIFELSQIDGVKPPPQIRFSTLAQWVQMPNMQERIQTDGLNEYAKYARFWLDNYAPESERFTVAEKMPEAALQVTDAQKIFLKRVASELETVQNAEELQVKLFEIAKICGISTKDAFAAIYKSILGKDFGPKAAWLILSLDRGFVTKRFEDIANTERKEIIAPHPQSSIVRFDNPHIFKIDEELKKLYPSLSVGVAVINGVKIEKTYPDLEEEKKQLFKSFSTLTTQELNSFLEVQSYRKLYKEMGIDWHSRRPSPEALLRRIVLGKNLYSINTCVDSYNLIVMKNRVSIGAFDYAQIAFPTVLRFARKGERILLLGDEQETEYSQREIAYFDAMGGFNIDFNYRDAIRTAVTLSTKRVFINVDGVFDVTPQKVEFSLQEACEKIIRNCGGNLEMYGVVTAS